LADVEAAFNLSYKQLKPETAHVFANLAVFPATFSQDAEKTICGDVGGRNLSHLVSQGLVLFSEKTERYHLHDLLRLFAHGRLSESERDMRIRHAEYFAETLARAEEIYVVDGEEFRIGVELFETERSNIITAWTWVIKEFNENKSLASLCSRFAKVGGRITGRQLLPEQRIMFYEAAASAALSLNQPELRAEHLFDQAQAIYDTGRQQEIGRSMQLLQEALDLTKVPELRVLILTQIGRNHLRVEPSSNRTKRAALDCHEKAWQIAQKTGDIALKVRSISRLAATCFTNYQQYRALSLFDSALAMVKPSQQRLKTYVLNGYGGMWREPLYRKKLIPLLQEARQLAAKFGSKRNGKDANFKLGMYLLDSDPTTALDCFRTSLEMNQALGDQRGAAGSYRDIGRAHLKLNQFAEAIAALNEANSLCQIIHWERGLRDVGELLEKARRASR
jgi:tetratricopeptide (TPR) repeat protein